MTKEYIEREKAIKEAITERDLHSPFTPELCGWRVGAEKVANRLASIPAADVVEVRHGQWHDVYMSSASTFVGTCSVCGISNDIPPVPLAKYCPSCGAKMDKEN